MVELIAVTRNYVLIALHLNSNEQHKDWIARKANGKGEKHILNMLLKETAIVRAL